MLQTTPSSRVLVPYDNTNGFTTAMAIINTGAANQTYITTDNGQFQTAVSQYFANPTSL